MWVESGEGIESFAKELARVLRPEGRVESGEGIESPSFEGAGPLRASRWNPVKELKVDHLVDDRRSGRVCGIR